MGEADKLINMINQAMQAQRRSVRVYELIATAANSAKDKELLHTIRREERRHYYLLEGIYEDLTGQGVETQKVTLSLPKHFPDMLKTAICDKLEVIDHMDGIRNEMNCVRHKDLMNLIISDQKEHARILAAIYGRL
jgi:rubrerythrin